MSAEPSASFVPDTKQRDRLLRRLIGVFTLAAFAALGMAVATASRQRTADHEAPVSLAQDRAE